MKNEHMWCDCDVDESVTNDDKDELSQNDKNFDKNFVKIFLKKYVLQG